jgi:hypothetical protein
MGIQITPSVLNADLSRLADEVARIPSSDSRSSSRSPTRATSRSTPT